MDRLQKPAHDPVSKKTRKLLESHGIRLIFDHRDDRSTKRRLKQVHHSTTHDFLQYLPFVSRFVTKTYDIGRDDLDYACYLYPIGFFTRGDLLKVPTANKMNMARLVRKGVVRAYVGKKGSANQVFELTPNAKRAVTAFNKYLLNFEQMPILQHKVGKVGRDFADKVDAMVQKLKKG